MKGFSGQYMNELVSLTILALMAIALIAGQAEATLEGTTRAAAGVRAQTLEAIADAAAIRADVAISIDLRGLAAFAIDDAENGTRIEFRTAGRR